MKWILFTIMMLSENEAGIVQSEPFNSMEACFNERDAMIEAFGRPIINYQAICVPYIEGYKPNVGTDNV